MGELTAVNALTQFALVTTLILAIISILGPGSVARSPSRSPSSS